MSAKKGQIMQAALQLFVDQGFEGTSTAAITRKAGVAAGTLFHHFDNKQNLIDAIYFKVKSDMSDAFRSGLGEEDDARAKFRNVWMKFMHFCVENPDSFRFAEIFSNSAQISEPTATKARAQFLDILHQLIEIGRLENRLKDLPDELIFSMMTSLSVATAWYLIEHPEQLENPEFIDRAAASCWHAISSD